ncbi:MAG TPA: hypothetical protein VNJ50_05445 [Gelidibacter sp.]|uniref:hypothetical protein n=1 Tax=Gelidibacter sp. TaxID=2018083 RepID=UPI002B8926CE|nr:hypothetical protein [Gelidibacter sp.]HXJ98270.1 hypothetical protein [Gelidibacter sp.]
MKQLLIALLWVGIAIPFNVQAQEIVTVTGKITVEDTGKPPVGIITINEKGVADYLVFGNNIGTNHHTFMEKDGTFKFTVQKGATVVIKNGRVRYEDPLPIQNITEDQTVEIKLKKMARPIKTDIPDEFEKDFNIYKRVRIAGKVTDSKNKPIGNTTVYQNKAINERGANNHTVTDNYGNFSYTIQKGSYLGFASPGMEYKHIKIIKDTTMTVTLNNKM